jgi:hypothetical protein
MFIRKQRIEDLYKRVHDLEAIILDPDFFEWKSTNLRKYEDAKNNKMFYLTSETDTHLLEDVISRLNENPGLCALFKTSDGTTLSLQVFNKGDKEDNE